MVKYVNVQLQLQVIENQFMCKYSFQTYDSWIPSSAFSSVRQLIQYFRFSSTTTLTADVVTCL